MEITKDTKLADILAADDVELIPFETALDSLNPELFQQLDTDCGQIPFQSRFVLILLFSSAADGDLNKREISYIRKKVSALQSNGEPISKEEAEQAVEATKDFLTVQNMVDSLIIFKKYFQLGALKAIGIDMVKAAGHDDLDPKESEMVRLALLYWYGVVSDADLRAAIK